MINGQVSHVSWMPANVPEQLHTVELLKGMRVFGCCVCNSHVTATPHCAHRVILLEWKYYTCRSQTGEGCCLLLVSLLISVALIYVYTTGSYTAKITYSKALSCLWQSEVIPSDTMAFFLYICHLSLQCRQKNTKLRNSSLFNHLNSYIISFPHNLFYSLISLWMRVTFSILP